jgi:hypothetical protein
MSSVLRKMTLMLAVAGTAAGCAMGGGGGDGAALARPAETAVPKGTEDPRAKPAVQAYESFTQAVIRAQQKPVAEPSAYPETANFTRYSFDPIAGEIEATIKLLSLEKREVRGTPPRSRITVTSIDPDARPWPTVTLSDCPAGRQGWQAFDIRTSKPVTDVEPRIPPPNVATITVVFTEQHWGVHTITLDSTRACAG